MTGNEDMIGFFKLVPMRQLVEARRSDDDWTGLKDQTERRKRQTRLALRLFRMYSRALLYTRIAAINHLFPGSR